jgi:N-acetylglucosaminyldiphosphoundecaprenol N-acetyl-beta-D-mannosaminyltransferase
VDVLGVNVSAVDIPRAVSAISGWIERGERHYVCVTGVHGVMESRHDPELRAIHNASGLTVPDGMPLVWLAKRGGYPDTMRVYGPDLMLAVCDASLSLGHRHFFYGGGDGVADLLADRLRARFPGLAVAGTYTPPFGELSDDEAAAIERTLNAAKADIVWVGLSTPKQERWMSRWRPRLDAPVLIGVGAAFDFHAGLKPQAPPWMQRSGLEWLYRFAKEPKRLGPRYLKNNPAFVAALAKERVVGRNRASSRD